MVLWFLSVFVGFLECFFSFVSVWLGLCVFGWGLGLGG